MSDPQQPAPEPQMSPPPQPTPAPSQPSAMSSMVSSMSQWELFLVGGALIIVLGDLIFGLLVREYYAPDVIWGAAAVALVAFAANRRASSSVPMYLNVMLLAGAIVALLGAREFVYDLLTVLRNLNVVGPAYLLGFVVWVIGVALMAWGTWLAWKSRAA